MKPTMEGAAVKMAIITAEQTDSETQNNLLRQEHRLGKANTGAGSRKITKVRESVKKGKRGTEDTKRKITATHKTIFRDKKTIHKGDQLEAMRWCQQWRALL